MVEGICDKYAHLCIFEHIRAGPRVPSLPRPPLCFILRPPGLEVGYDETGTFRGFLLELSELAAMQEGYVRMCRITNNTESMQNNLQCFTLIIYTDVQKCGGSVPEPSEHG